MKTRISATLSWCLLVIEWRSLAHAEELASMRTLQVGPVGDGIVFVSPGPADAELEFGFTRAVGSESAGDDKLSSERTTRYSTAGFAFGINRELSFFLALRASSTAYSASARYAIHSDFEDSSRLSIIAGPVLAIGSVVLGGEVGALVLGEETRQARTTDSDAKHTIEGTTIPLIQLHGGWRGEHTAAAASIKAYNDAPARVRSTTSAGGNYEYDVKRRSAGELDLDVKHELFRKLTVGLEFTYVGAQQAATDVGEYDVDFSYAPSERSRRKLQGIPTNVDYGALGVGGVYQAEPWIAFAGSYHYTEPSYADENHASLQAGNLGGSRIDIGTHYATRTLRAAFSAGYSIPRRVDYTPSAGQGWQEPGSESRAEQAAWDVKASACVGW